MNTKQRENRMFFSVHGQTYSLPVSEIERVFSLRRSDISPLLFDIEQRFTGIINVRGSVAGIIRCPQLIADSYVNGCEELTAIHIRFVNESFILLVDGIKDINEKTDENVTDISAAMIDSGEFNACDK